MKRKGRRLLIKYFSELDTPSLLLNLNQVEKNIDDIFTFAKNAGVSVRPHMKTHKSIEIAKRQLNAGAVGITVAKVGEAEVFIRKGITDVLIAYPLIAKQKLERVKQLMDRATITVAVDSKEQAMILNEFFSEENRLNVWIKVNSGLNRIGVEPNEEVVTLAKYIKSLQHLNLTGLFTHAGQSYAATSLEEIKQIGIDEANAIVTSADLCEQAGIYIKHRSVGSTPTFKYAGVVDGITEIRPGNAVFYDMVQVGLGVAKIEQCALKVLTRVVSTKSNRIVIDAGSKTLALDQGAHGNESIKGHGYVEQYPELTIERLSEEHGVIPLNKESDIKLNEQLTIIPNHACTVANLFDYYVVHHNGKIIDKWKIDARGKIK